MAQNAPLPLNPRLARQIIEVLGQSGTPPPRGIAYYNVGNEELLSAMEKHYFSSYLADGGAVFKLVVGDYGAGKSHFLYCLRDLAWKHQFAVSKVDLSPKENPYDDQRRIYAAVAANLLWNDPQDATEDERGLARFLLGTLRRLIAPMDPDDPAAMNQPEVRATLETLKITPIDSLSYQHAVIAYFECVMTRRELLTDSLTRWLHGDEVSAEDLRNLRTVGVTEKITKNNAFKMLRSLCQMVRALSYGGLVLLFDEGDRMLSIGGKAEKVSTDNLREVIDRCREDLPGAMFAYAVPPSFLKETITKYEALHQRVNAPMVFSRRNPFSPIINLETLDMPERDLLRQIGEKLLPIFEIAFDLQLDHPTQLANIDQLVSAAAESYLSTNQRRLFIKSLVAEWFQQSQTAEYVIDAEYAQTIIRNENRALDVLADGEQRPY